ncbi:MAG: TlpA disulfide reductase family protein [Kofleriaceae bacterium]
MSTKALIGFLLAGTVGILVFLFVHFSGSNGKIHVGTQQARACAKSTNADDCLPDVKYIDTAGHAYTADSLLGKVVVVNFWATWCGPCKKEIPDLSKLSDKYKDKGVVFLGIMADNPAPSDNDLLNFQSDFMMSYPVVRVNSDLNVAFNYPQNLPTTFIFDKTGHRAGRARIGAISAESLSAQLDELVAAAN